MLQSIQPEIDKKTEDVPMQLASLDIWDTKYRLKTEDGDAADDNISDTRKRVARALAEVEKPENEEFWYHEFLSALESGATPAGRIMSNAGAQDYKPNTSLINCTVSDAIPDSMDGILSKVHESGLTLKSGCGIGYDFSTLRPRGAFVSGAGSHTNGPLGFMDIYDQMCFTIASAGGRRGAQMATFDVSHPDILEFIQAKREDGRLRQFNCSVLITDEFMRAVEADEWWDLVFPVDKKEAPPGEPRWNGDLPDYVWKEWPVQDENYVTKNGEVLCRIYSKVKARVIWDAIMESTYDYAEPGFILIDEINRQNNLWFDEKIRATNPCGEQPLPPYGACLLGSVNLTKFVINPFTPIAEFDWEKYEWVVAVFTRMLDNVVEISNLPLPQQRAEIERKRRHGMGFLGLGSTLSMLGVRYGSPGAIKLTEEFAKRMAVTGWKIGVDLAKEKGPAPIFDESVTVTQKISEQSGQEVWTGVSTRGLFVRSKYMEKIFDVEPGLKHDIMKHGCRFTHHTSIAPTGTISLSFGNNASNGIEPSFSHKYSRNLIVSGKKSKEKVDVLSFELLAYRHFVDPNAEPGDLPETCVTADSVGTVEHVKMQAAAQKWIDSSISKTINVPTDIDYESFKDVYRLGWDLGLKGCTTFRFNPEAFSGVLVRDEDLKNTLYEFTTADGQKIEVTGDQVIEYDGEEHTASNLYDALKEGYYGKF